MNRCGAKLPRFDPGKMYLVDGPLLNLVDRLKDRLFAEQTFNANQQRDWANALDHQLNTFVIEAEPPKDPITREWATPAEDEAWKNL